VEILKSLTEEDDGFAVAKKRTVKDKRMQALLALTGLHETQIRGLADWIVMLASTRGFTLPTLTQAGEPIVTEGTPTTLAELWSNGEEEARGDLRALIQDPQLRPGPEILVITHYLTETHKITAVTQERGHPLRKFYMFSGPQENPPEDAVNGLVDDNPNDLRDADDEARDMQDPEEMDPEAAAEDDHDPAAPGEGRHDA